MSQIERLSKWVKAPVTSAKASVKETVEALREQPRLAPVVERLDDLVERHVPAVLAPLREAEKVSLGTLKAAATVAGEELRAFVRGRPAPANAGESKPDQASADEG